MALASEWQAHLGRRSPAQTWRRRRRPIRRCAPAHQVHQAMDIKRHHRGQSGATQPTLCTTFSPSSAIERQPSPIRRNQAQSGAIRRNQAQSGAPSSAEAAPPRPRHRAAPRRAYRPRRSHPRASHGSAATRTLRAPRASPAARAQSSAIERDRTAAERNRTRSNVIRCRRAQSNVF